MPTLTEAQAAYERACQDRDAAVTHCATLRRAVEEANRVLERAVARLGDAQRVLDAAFAAERAREGA